MCKIPERAQIKPRKVAPIWCYQITLNLILDRPEQGRNTHIHAIICSLSYTTCDSSFNSSQGMLASTKAIRLQTIN